MRGIPEYQCAGYAFVEGDFANLWNLFHILVNTIRNQWNKCEIGMQIPDFMVTFSCGKTLSNSNCQSSLVVVDSKISSGFWDSRFF